MAVMKRSLKAPSIESLCIGHLDFVSPGNERSPSPVASLPKRSSVQRQGLIYPSKIEEKMIEDQKRRCAKKIHSSWFS